LQVALEAVLGDGNDSLNDGLMSDLITLNYLQAHAVLVHAVDDVLQVGADSVLNLAQVVRFEINRSANVPKYLIKGN